MYVAKRHGVNIPQQPLGSEANPNRTYGVSPLYLPYLDFCPVTFLETHVNANRARPAATQHPCNS